MQLMRQFFSRSLLVGLATMVTALGILGPLAAAQTSDTAARDCGDNAILRCGAYSTAELSQKYDSQAGAASIFAHFDISSTDVNNMGTTAKNGYVTKGGRVLIGDETVATNATTVGRQDIAGSTKVTRNETTFYTRPPSASFQQEKLDAYVVMKDGKFDYAVIKSCGNPVSATPVEPPTPTPPPAPAPTPPPPVPVTLVATPPAPSSAQCRMLTATILQNRQVSARITGSTDNAQIIGYRIDFGDGTLPTDTISSNNNTDVRTASTSNSIANNVASGANTAATNSTSNSSVTAASSTTETSSQAIIHQYAKDGTYSITAYIQARYTDGRTEYKTSQTCTSSVSFNTPVVPVATTPSPPAPVIPPAPPVFESKSLPSVGSNVSSVIGVSVLIGIASSFAYAIFASWRIKLYS